MSPTNEGGEEADPKCGPVTNVSPPARRAIESSGILSFLPFNKREGIERFFGWRIQKAIDGDGDPEQGFKLQLEHHRTGEVGIWLVRCTLLDERGAEYYDVSDLVRIDPGDH